MLKRNDSGQDPLVGNLLIWLMDVERRLCRIPYRLKCEIKGKETTHNSFDVHKHYKCLLREEDNFTFLSDALIVKITFLISGCHEEDMDKRKNKLPPSGQGK
ncbi:hypothetical protein AVEN_17943-1 [Araneus ventricosus]|uniref:Uncharacterized protein n=1 Tax=Araneus ventricosus TaxID=182803 RepID=A0A4Y2PS81_ARAVE|nr:hypothetical protein AVEN_17943-1 [Araneus ventricosus]